MSAKLLTLKTGTVYITTDTRKMWRCATLRFNAPRCKGKLPVSAGERLIVNLPPLTRKQFLTEVAGPILCNSRKFWFVAKQNRGFKHQPSKRPWVCTHLIDEVKPKA